MIAGQVPVWPETRAMVAGAGYVQLKKKGIGAYGGQQRRQQTETGSHVAKGV